MKARSVLLLLVPLLLAALLSWILWPRTESEAIDLVSSGPSFATLAELDEASDLVVIGTVGQIDAGRTISDDADPDAGITTSLIEIDVEQVLRGSAGATVVVEHETGLADGTPITVDGVAAPALGDRLLVFLVAGGSEAFPHHAIVSNEGRFVVSGTQAIPVVDGPIGEAVGAMTIDEIAAAVG